jgi:hypothetical protein
MRRRSSSRFSVARLGPLATQAQQPVMPVIGFLSSISQEESSISAFQQGFSEFGYLEGRNVSI